MCVLTASDERQAEIYRKQLEWRTGSGLLPPRTEFVVLPDPEGPRIGSGGATLRSLGLSTARHPQPTARRTLIIHSGGDARRLPHCSAPGKLFARIPRTLPDGRASTVFDEFLISLCGLAEALPPGALVASGDVLLVFDHLQLAFRRQGVTGVAASAPAEMGLRHGVFVTESGSHRVHAYLHKPDAGELTRWAAIESGRVQIDTGLVWLDGDTVGSFAELYADPHVSAAPLNLYGDLLLPLAQSNGWESYLADTSDGLATPAVRAARQVLWPRLRAAPFTVERLQPAVFVHFGASREYYDMVATDAPLAALCGWERRVASWVAPAAQDGRGSDAPDDALVLIAAAVAGPLTPAPAPLLVTDSDLRGPLRWDGAGLIAGVSTGTALDLRCDIALDQLPLPGDLTVTRVWGLHDDPKRPFADPRATFCNRLWAEWLAEAGIAPQDIWPGLSSDRCTLWEARLYPALTDAEAGLALTLPLQAPGEAMPGWRKRWLDAPRLSLGESAARAAGGRLLKGLIALEDAIGARRFCAAILAERPAAEAKTLLGAPPAGALRRAEIAAELLNLEPWEIRLRGLRGLAEATGDPIWEERAFSLLAGKIEAATLRPFAAAGATPARRSRPPQVWRMVAAARIDFGGGWTDTPPHSIERGGAVLNAALTLRGAHPIVVEARVLREPRLVLESRDLDTTCEPERVADVLSYANPADTFALHKAALVLRGLFGGSDPQRPVRDVMQAWGGGLHLSTATHIPLGSGLGTSSILAGAVLAALGRVLGETADDMGRLFDEVLCLEQMLTTGGGWQDQVGGLTGGIKLVTSQPGLPQSVQVAPLALAEHIQAEVDRRLVVFYTGQQRLAKNLLRHVMSRWMARDPEMVWIQGEIARLALAMRDALLGGDVDSFGALLGEHWAINKRMDPGCTNPFIDSLFAAMAPFIHGGKLAGAGGGGFGMAILRCERDAAALAAALAERFGETPVGLWPASIPAVGLVSEDGAGGAAGVV